MIIVDDYKNALNSILHPGASTQKSMGVLEALVYYWKSTLIPMVILLIEAFVAGSLLGAAFGSLLSSTSSSYSMIGGALLGGGLAVFVFVAWLIVLPISMLIDAFVLHIFGKFLLRWFKGGYAQTFAGVAYGTSAALALIWIPLVGSLIALIAGIVVSLVAIANQNKTTWVMVLATVIITAIVIWVIMFLLAHL